MRIPAIALGLILLLASSAAGFEIEEERWFGAVPRQDELHIISTTDTAIFAPLIEGYLQRNPKISVRYVVTDSQALYGALADEGAAFDVAISSAMDLQIKLANDGLALAHRSDQTANLPGWAHWRDQLFAFAQEPVVIAVSHAGLGDLPLPANRADLTRLIRDHPEHFRGRIGTYDPNLSGAGYLFATQDARQSDTFWRLAEVIGRVEPKLYGTTGAMIADLKSGRLALAYNVLGSYASAQLADWPDAEIIEPGDYTHVLLRTALVPSTAIRPGAGRDFLDFLLSDEGQALVDQATGLPRIDGGALAVQPHLRPIRLDPGLLVYVDPLKRRKFLEEWSAAVIQP